MRPLIKFVRNIVVNDPVKPLGRWGIDYCSIKTDMKVDLSNEDHCGPCGQYAITKGDDTCDRRRGLVPLGDTLGGEIKS